jgi:hypothetical protein
LEIRQAVPNDKAAATAEITSVAAGMADRNHPSHPLYRQAYDGLEQLDPKKVGVRSEQKYRNAAGTLV